MNRVVCLVAVLSLTAPRLMSANQAATPRDAATTQTDTKSPAFEVAEIKRNRSGVPMSGSADINLAGHVHLTAVPLRLLISAAWQVKEYAIVGAPAWVASERYDLAANTPPGTSNDDFHVMLRNLLIERFRLVAHNSEKVMNAYALIVDKGGPKMQETIAENSTEIGCSGRREQGMAHRTCKNLSMELFATVLPGLAPPLHRCAGRKPYRFKWPLRFRPFMAAAAAAVKDRSAGSDNL